MAERLAENENGPTLPLDVTGLDRHFYPKCPSRGKSLSLKATGDIYPPLLPSLPRAEYFLHVLRREKTV